MGESKRDCNFIVVTNTGEQPDAQICMAAFNEPDGMNVCSQLNGGGQDIVRLVDNLVQHVMKSLREKDVDGNQEAAFIAILLGTIESHADQKALARAMEMMDEAKSKKKELEEALAHMKENPAAALKALAELMEMGGATVHTGDDLDLEEFEEEEEE